MSPSVVASYAPDPTPEGTSITRVDDRPVDVLILTALQDELEAVLALAENGRAGWQEQGRERLSLVPPDLPERARRRV
jgi:hypothetical protein